MNEKVLISDRVNRIKVSASVAANALVRQLREEGHDIINFTVGEPDFDTPANIVQAAYEAMKNGETHYTPSNGTMKLRKAVCTKLSRDNNLRYSPEEIVCGSGAKHIISSAFASTLNAGDEVVIHSPYWVSYPDLATLNEAKPVIIEGNEKSGFKVSASELRDVLTDNTKWVVLNYPNNPSGAVYTHSELVEIAEVLRDYPNVLVMLDEIYELFVYGDLEHVSLANVAPDLRDRILLINGASKGYAMTGWRLGYGAGPKWLITAINKLISQTTSCASSVSQAAAAEAFAGNQQPVRNMLEVYEQRRDRICSLLGMVEGLSFFPPSGAFYLFINVSGLLNRTTPANKVLTSDDDVVEYLLREGGVATVTGRAYGMSPYIRISYASSMQVIEEGCQRIQETIAKLK